MTEGRKKYTGLGALSHILLRPDTYVGSVRKIKRELLSYDEASKKLIPVESDLPDAVIRIFLEIISNAGDNADNSRRSGVDPGSIRVTADSKTISLQNEGLCIPVKRVTRIRKNGNTQLQDYQEGDEEDFYLPEFIFGELRTSNNYDKTQKNMGVGKNGYGAKLANIFSTHFQVEIHDPNTKLKFIGTWKDNMFKDNVETRPEVNVETDPMINRGIVKISWTLDFPRFQMKSYRPLDLQILTRICIDFSFTCKIKTYFNEVELDYRNINDYSKLIWGEEEIKNSLVHYVWEEGAPDNLKKANPAAQMEKVVEAKRPEHIPELEIMILDTPDSGRTISYVNGMITSDGGVHADAAQEPIFKNICQLVNGEKKRGKKTTSVVIKSQNVKSHLSFIVSGRLANPEYTSQSKTKLSFPNVVFEYPEKIFKTISQWKVISRMYAELEAIAFRKTSNNDGHKKKHITLLKGEDANLAGTKDAYKCNLYIVEGISAANYPQKRIPELQGGKDLNGYLPLKGKFLNTTNASPEKYANNDEISLIKQVVGLREGVDYTKEENRKALRYGGRIILLMDEDPDGKHIGACVINFFKNYFPGIIKANMLGYMRTPLIKLLRGDKISRRFFTTSDFIKWRSRNEMKGLSVRYYKGLGTSNDDDIKDDLKIAPTVICFYDSKCEENLDLAFHGDNANQRKKWIEDWRDVSQVEDVLSVDINSIVKTEDKLIQGQDISQFINRELIGYSVSSLFRAIPSEFDHLKDSQRKALYAALKFFNYDPKKGKSIKVGRFANKAADMTQYHHGEKSLTDTIIKMAQNFIGSNNMEWFKPDGQFGTRADGGENAADARYSETHLQWWIPFVYYKESVELVEKRIIDDEACEPQWIPGVIPMGVVNGTTGIATAFSTSTPCHNPLDVIHWYKAKCRGEETKPILPWFNKFKGTMKIINRNPDESVQQEEVEEEEGENVVLDEDDVCLYDNESQAIVRHCRSSRLTLKTFGKFKITGVHKNDGPIIEITELPVRSWMIKTRNWLSQIVQQKENGQRLIYDFKDHSTTEKPHFTIHWNKDLKTPNFQNLHLVRSFGISNITLIDHKGFPTRFDSIQQVMERYYKVMLDHYNELRDHRISVEEKKVRDISFKMKFIIHVLKKDITIIKVKEEIVKEKMRELGIPEEYYEKSKSKDFSEESVQNYREELEEAKARLGIAKENTAEKIWLQKLDRLETEISKRFSRGVLNMKR